MDNQRSFGHNPWAIALTVTLATFMEVLDTSIANVSLPHIAGGLGATQDQATWVITSYLVSNAVVLPVSSYMTSLVGRKKFYMSCVALFGLSSLLCGLAPSLPLLLLFRVMQGAGGGGLGPSEQAILADTFPPEKRGQAFALYGLAVVVAPAIGPTLGGWITDNYDWRWIFFINIPVALLSLFLTQRLVEDPPHIQKEVAEARRGKFQLDYLGFAFVALTFGSLEFLLDKGQEDDWFGSLVIRVFFALFVFGFVSFISWELWQVRKGQRPILDLRLFMNRNLALGFLMMLMIGFALYSSTVLLPQLLQNLMGYTAEQAGFALSLGGITTMLSMPIVGFLIGKVDARALIVFGFAVLAVSLYQLSGLDLSISFSYAAKMRAFQASGLGFLFIPISTLAYVGVPMTRNNDVSALINLARNVGGSVGTSFVTTMLARSSQSHQNYLVANAQNGSSAFTDRIAAMTQAAMAQSGSQVDAQHHALAQFYAQLQQQAGIMAYVDILRYIAFAAIIFAPMAYFLKKAPKGAEVAVH